MALLHAALVRSVFAGSLGALVIGCSWTTDLDDLDDGADAATSLAPAAGATAGAGGASATGAASGHGSATSGAGGIGGNSSYAALVLSDQPVGYWRLGETLVESAADEGPNHYDGAYLGGVVVGAPGALAADSNTAAHFDGVEGAVDMGVVLDFVGSSPFSLEVWASPDSNGGVPRTICSKMDYDGTMGTSDGYSLHVVAQYGTIFVRGDHVVMDAVVAPVLPTGSYSHVVATFDGMQMRLYVDGQEAASVPSTSRISPNVRPLLVGATDDNFSYPRFHGKIDEVAIYDHALQAERVSAHHAAGAAR